jgi:Ras-related protein Rab-5C
MSLKEETGPVKNSSANKRPKSQKLVLIGDSNVGKTSIIDQFIDGKFGETKPSIGALHKLKTINLSSGEEVQLDIWDTAGQEKFKSIVPMYYKGSKGIMIIFDVTCLESFEGAKKWIGDIESSYNSAILFLVGNKIDIEESRVISTEQAQSYATSKNLIYFECSAKTNIGVAEVFRAIAEKMPKTVENNNTSKLTLNKSPSTSEEYSCCK